MSNESESTPELDAVKEQVAKELASTGISESLQIEGIDVDALQIKKLLEPKPQPTQDNGSTTTGQQSNT